MLAAIAANSNTARRLHGLRSKKPLAQWCVWDIGTRHKIRIDIPAVGLRRGNSPGLD
jgi:hypothetical protein